MVSDLAKQEQASWRQRLQRAYNRPEYDEARTALETLHRELEDRNQSAAGSLAKGLDETLTLHRLGLYGVLGRTPGASAVAEPPGAPRPSGPRALAPPAKTDLDVP